ncbi:hypothetical protein [Bradyrhizobium australafricanum]|uniref:hypothetical protein n=1 Tax=Bradyrhizobium australafricanum TaxID=2821406 RepID=UPI001CE2E2EE|nr:hypothetical protein [Bradyrhizobium australafricanum]MCA6098301.1 hypothetical protein [Bradyrhizobium australafricanum]
MQTWPLRNFILLAPLFPLEVGFQALRGQTMRSVLAAILFFSFHLFAFAQERPPIHRAYQISMTIDVLWNARAAVTKYPLDQRIKLYQMVSVRLTQCGLLYAVINKEAPKEKKDAQTSASFDGISRVYMLAGSITYPETGAPYQKMLESSLAQITKMKQTNDRVQPVIILKSCKDLAGTEEDAAKAIARLPLE